MESKAKTKAGASGAGEAHDAQSLPQSLFEMARLQRDRRKSDRNNADRRRSERVEVEASASLSTTAGHVLEGKLYNLSAHGCSISLPDDTLGLGDVVWLKIDTVQPWMGTVRWVSQGKVGVEFEVPFHRSIFGLIAAGAKSVKVCKSA